MLRVFVAGHPIDSTGVDSLRAALPRHGLRDVQLEIVQSDVSAEDLRRLQGDVQRDIVRAVSTSLMARDSSAQTRRRQDSLRVATAARELVV